MAKSSWLTSTSIGDEPGGVRYRQPPRRKSTATLRLNVIADQEVVRGANSHVVMRDRREAEKSPGARVGRDDLTDAVERQMQEFGIPGDRQADPPRLAGEGRSLAEPRAGLAKCAI